MVRKEKPSYYSHMRVAPASNLAALQLAYCMTVLLPSLVVSAIVLGSDRSRRGLDRSPDTLWVCQMY